MQFVRSLWLVYVLAYLRTAVSMPRCADFANVLASPFNVKVVTAFEQARVGSFSSMMLGLPGGRDQFYCQTIALISQA